MFDFEPPTVPTHEDNRPVASIYTAHDVVWRVDHYSPLHAGQTIEKIVPYYENGQGAPVVWFAVYAGGVIVARVNAAFVEHIKY